MESEFVFDSVEKAVDAFKRGELVVVMDDESRENEGDIIVSASSVTAEQVTLMILNTSGILCVAMPEERARHLDLPPMLIHNTDLKQTAFTVSCDVEGTSTGVSAPDRVITIQALANPTAQAHNFRKPGHIFPLVARAGGVLERRGHTEATVDFCQFAGFNPPVGLLAELMNKDGNMSRLPDCYAFAKQHGLCITTVEALAQYKSQRMMMASQTPLPSLSLCLPIPHTTPTPTPSSTPTTVPITTNTNTNSTATYNGCEVSLLAECDIPIGKGDKDLGIWKLRCYKSMPDECIHSVLIKGDVSDNEGFGVMTSSSSSSSPSTSPVLVRIHSECFTAHVLGSQRCDCSQQLDACLEAIHQTGRGVAIYVAGHEGRGIGLVNKVRAYQLQLLGKLDTYQANQHLGLPIDSRKYDAPRAILAHLQVRRIVLMTNNPLKMSAFDDIAVDAQAVLCRPTQHNTAYLHSKRRYESLHANPDILSSPNLKRAAEQNKLRVQSAELLDAAPVAMTMASLPLPDLESIKRMRIGIIGTSWNPNLVDMLVQHCCENLIGLGVLASHIVRSEVWDVPGAFELPFSAQRLARSGQVDAIICFGILLKGETQQADSMGSAVAQGLMQVQVATDVPILNGVLDGVTPDQATARCRQGSSLHLSLASTAIRMASFNLSTRSTLLGAQGHKEERTLSSPMVQPCSFA